jgi:hypothetical protein
MKILIAGVLLVCAAFCQTASKKELRPFTPPEFRAVNPLIAKDEGCAKDLAKVPRMEGLEQRKFLADLFAYGCVRLSPGEHLVNILGLREVGEGDKKIQVSHVKLFSKTTTEVIDGWTLSGDLISQDLIDKVLAELELLKKK